MFYFILNKTEKQVFQTFKKMKLFQVLFQMAVYTTSKKIKCWCEIHNFSSSYYSSGRCSKNAASYVSRYIKLRHCGISPLFWSILSSIVKILLHTTRDFGSLGLWERRLWFWLFIKNVLQQKSWKVGIFCSKNRCAIISFE